MVNYFELGKNKQLNEIVVAGSHDAGITGKGGNVRTQELDIGGQAQAGVRVFDLRIAAASTGYLIDGEKGAELRAFHAAKKTDQAGKTRQIAGLPGPVTLTVTKLNKGGDFGLGLTKMLGDAKAFVKSKDGGTEFLILKFDKCLNWPLIAEACVEELRGVLYTGGGNLNTTQLKDLQGQVIVLFSSGGLGALAGARGPADGILTFKNLYGGGDGYSSKFDGLQYYGKGGTSVAKPFKKRGQNEKKQGKLMEGAKLLGNPEVMGMMYWTSTGIFENIEKRNDKMWDAPNKARLRRLWEQGLGDMVSESIPLDPPKGSAAVGPLRKRYMPNIVMIDFADPHKCKQIRELNDLPPDVFVDLE